ncbi:hypothetical protein U1Q18_014434 [Sarracenia purpurea var. burkii]
MNGRVKAKIKDGSPRSGFGERLNFDLLFHFPLLLEMDMLSCDGDASPTAIGGLNMAHELLFGPLQLCLDRISKSFILIPHYPLMQLQRMVEEEELQFHEEYMNEQDPSILHFLLASGDDVSSKQLRDDLMTMLIAGHETTAAVLTWTFYLLSKVCRWPAELRWAMRMMKCLWCERVEQASLGDMVVTSSKGVHNTRRRCCLWCERVEQASLGDMVVTSSKGVHNTRRRCWLSQLAMGR